MNPSSLSPIDSGTLSPSINWSKWVMAQPVPQDFGQWMLANGLHSSGSDFTSHRISHSNPGSSLLRKLWSQGELYHQEGDELLVWLLHDSKSKDKPIGVMAWERMSSIGKTPSIEISGAAGLDQSSTHDRSVAEAKSIGRVSLWVDPKFRGRGWLRELIQLDVAKALRDRALEVMSSGAFPFLRCADATPTILSRFTDIPMTSTIYPGIPETKTLQDLMASETARGGGWSVDWVNPAGHRSKPRRP